MESRLHDMRTTNILSRRRRDLQGHLIVAAGVFTPAGTENYTDLDDYQYDRQNNFFFTFPEF